MRQSRLVLRLDDGSRMSGDVHVRFCEGLGVKLPGATHPWWGNDDIGLRRKIIDEADATSGGLSGLIVAIAPSLAGEKQLDAVTKAVLANAPASWSNNDLVTNNAASSGVVGTAQQWVKGSLATGGVVVASALFSVTMSAILQGLPMVQAVLLLGIYALLPLLVVMSRYSLSMLMIGAMAIFTVATMG